MDRNTLLAFFLISLVLIFTPKYIELISGETRIEEKNPQNNEPEAATLKTVKNSPVENFDLYSSNEIVVESGKPKTELTTVVENNLF